MASKKTIYLGPIIGSMIGSVIPHLWGGSDFSFVGLLFGAIGGLLGIWLAFKLI